MNEAKKRIDLGVDKVRKLINDWYEKKYGFGTKRVAGEDALVALLADVYHFVMRYSENDAAKAVSIMNNLVLDARNKFQMDMKFAAGLVVQDGDTIGSGEMSRVLCADCATEVKWSGEDQNHAGEWSGTCECPGRDWGAVTEDVTVSISESDPRRRPASG